MQNYKELAEKQIKLGKTDTLIKMSLSKYYLNEDKNTWLTTQKNEYDILFKTVEITIAEVIGEDGVIAEPAYTYFDYITGCISFADWLAETIVVTEEVQATYDEDGLELTPYISEVTKPIREFTAKIDYNEEIDLYLSKSSIYKEKQKAIKDKELDNLTITANTVVFDSNGKAIGNMSAVINLANFKYNQLTALDMINPITGIAYTKVEAYQFIYKDTLINWMGADNVVHSVQVESICEALELSMNEVAKVIGV